MVSNWVSSRGGRWQSRSSPVCILDFYSGSGLTPNSSSSSCSWLPLTQLTSPSRRLPQSPEMLGLMWGVTGSLTVVSHFGLHTAPQHLPPIGSLHTSFLFQSSLPSSLSFLHSILTQPTCPQSLSSFSKLFLS